MQFYSMGLYTVQQNFEVNLIMYILHICEIPAL